MPSFLTSLTDKAQAAVNASPLASHYGRPGSPGQDQHLAFRNGPLDSIQHQLRSFGQQYTSVSPVQKIITAEKGVALDFDNISTDSKTQSKELYTWGQGEAQDLKDVTDRLAYLNFVEGSLSHTLAHKLDSARTPFKILRDAENALTPRRNIRQGLALQISRIEHEQQKGTERRLAELKEQLWRHEEEDEYKEKQVEILKRRAVKESEQEKWDAIREYAEKLVLVSQSATPIISALPFFPPSDVEPYRGAQATAAARASLQRALDNYKTGRIMLESTGAELSRESSDTRSFGESHASELSSMASTEGAISTEPSLPLTPPAVSTSLPSDSAPDRATSQSPPMNIAALNNAPAPIPIPTSPTAATPSLASVVAPDSANPVVAEPAVIPTVAETGIPVSAGEKGPGPASGSLLDIHGASPTAGPRSAGLPGRSSSISEYGQGVPTGGAAATPPKFESAEEEKSRLQREDRERVLAAEAPPAATQAQAPAFESAEDEKKRLEREDRERVLSSGGNDAPGGVSGPKRDDEDLPPYQDM
ncbi:hypothetical protein PILCRDRAFT_817260 [Piloderma croceum F 1598]|uniref:Sphingolipid long chain base-responsive protein LSP1 n=1 Tax=Piloderma croceum (strain F 1598) TaxID=765440 RepID=A0A0C3G3T4_PILCF|nr:hypothetical protein PILCRDRAFT_817260 [Piloderma croceum F 1598]